ncbi:phosphoenolpyruvate--protein phosphotransferase [Paenibacillus selenitireducens]|uniref:Phosphoenolpyruvate-protein phosphotransferase n=1 Tax=Paenibacillus selenitireducens TaxID=1324314 RepID=A0A1T2XJM0_9BACL|nr:phosphoenolpyruvate--protein phosphotransferase [Paenibacillus selenitireducens]OPA80091.1 phosphoenolpyruvate--protein phosphotransferase [Paenibacillus selenitireducens]
MILKGIAAAPGYAIGPVFVMKDNQVKVERKTLSAPEAKAEVVRFSEIVNQAIEQVKEIQEQAREKMGDEQAEIFESHILVLHDDEFVGRTKEVILEKNINAEAALAEVTEELVAFFEGMDNEYMNERAADFRDLNKRLHGLLTGAKQASLSDFEEPVVLITDDLTPSDSAQLDRDRVAGFATNIGGRTSHSAIMARSMEIPAVVGLKDVTEQLHDGDIVILDGTTGDLIVHPSDEQIAAYRVKKENFAKRKAEFHKYMNAASTTVDGHTVELVANIGNPGDAHNAHKNGAEGIGLFRTEFLYMGRPNFPTEEEQFEAYKEVAETFGKDHPIVIRTLDIGGDKELDYLELPKEMNPFLGYRAIRLCLDETDMFKTQLRAILRASAFGNVKIMYPMIATIVELRAANAILAEVKAELDTAGIAYNKNLEVGIMIEIPAAVLVSDQLAKEADFFSIGTNDLVQYTMAADRMNEKVSHLTQPMNPSVLRLIRMVIENAHREGKWVGMCGEMAGNLVAIPLLLGLGLDEFSMSASSVLPARVLMSKISLADAKEIAAKALDMQTADEIQQFVQDSFPVIEELL